VKYFKINYKIAKKRDSIVVEAENRIEAMQKFFDMKIGILVKMQEVSKPLNLRWKEYEAKFNNPIKKRAVNTERFIALLDQIAIMLDAGLPLNYVLAESVKNEKDAMLKAIFLKINNDIEGGKGLYNAAETFKEQLGYIALSMFKLGEETGQLSESITHLISILQNILDNRKKFKKATRYPLVIIIAMAIAFTVVIVFVVPQFKSFFLESKMELPLPTQFLLWAEHAITAYGPYILASSVGIFIFINMMYKKSDKVKLFLDKFTLKIFTLGRTCHNCLWTIYSYLFCRYLYIYKYHI